MYVTIEDTDGSVQQPVKRVILVKSVESFLDENAHAATHPFDGAGRNARPLEAHMIL